MDLSSCCTQQSCNLLFISVALALRNIFELLICTQRLLEHDFRFLDSCKLLQDGLGTTCLWQSPRVYCKNRLPRGLNNRCVPSDSLHPWANFHYMFCTLRPLRAVLIETVTKTVIALDRCNAGRDV